MAQTPENLKAAIDSIEELQATLTSLHGMIHQETPRLSKLRVFAELAREEGKDVFTAVKEYATNERGPRTNGEETPESK